MEISRLLSLRRNTRADPMAEPRSAMDTEVAASIIAVSGPTMSGLTPSRRTSTPSLCPPGIPVPRWACPRDGRLQEGLAEVTPAGHRLPRAAACPMLTTSDLPTAVIRTINQTSLRATTTTTVEASKDTISRDPTGVVTTATTATSIADGHPTMISAVGMAAEGIKAGTTILPETLVVEVAVDMDGISASFENILD